MGFFFGGLAAVAHAADTIDFEATIRPLLVAKCGDCHGPNTQESGLRLDVRHRALKGGDFGPVILAGKAAESELVRDAVIAAAAESLAASGTLGKEAAAKRLAEVMPTPKSRLAMT